MHPISLLLLLPLVSLSLAMRNAKPLLAPGAQLLSARDDGCDSEHFACGDFCIALDQVCCPDESTVCQDGEYCFLGTNGIYGCCTDGAACGGAASQSTVLVTATSPPNENSAPTQTVNPASGGSATGSPKKGLAPAVKHALGGPEAALVGLVAGVLFI